MIKVIDVAYVRFSAPDLGAMKTFLEDFGLVVNAQQGDVLYARGSDPPPYLHVCEQGEAGFRGVAFEAASAGDLVAAARLEGASPIRSTICACSTRAPCAGRYWPRAARS